MKTLSCSKELREQIREVSNPKESVDAALNRLLDSYEDMLVNDSYLYGKTNVNLSDDTYNRIKECKVYEKESLTHVISRLLNIANEDKGEVIMKINDVEMSIGEFKKEFLDKLNILFVDNYNKFAICTPTAEVIDIVDVSFASDDDKKEFVDFVEELGY